MKLTDRPKDTDVCARERCSHEFGLHYLTHDRKTIGCAWSLDDQREGLMTCRCDGFLIEYVYPPQARD